jgi:tRNA-dihydrouridine synthase
MRIGPIALASPVVMAPLAGVKKVAFRTICRERHIGG